MPEFYREAILAAKCVEPPSGNGVAIPDLDSWQQVAEALDSLSPRQRCHAIYADWLLRLHHAVGGGDSLTIRDYILGQGALAANYLGEMAQNADDACASSLLVVLDGNWLLVANDGHRLSSLNLYGLCRFFIHSNGEVVGFTPETIGKFGIGFKACHRVAEEVIAWSWGDHEEFGFRLPICHGGGESSRPDQETLHTLLRCLEKVEKPIRKLRPHDQLGHCTPEVLNTMPTAFPASLLERIQDFRTDNATKGVWFALHLHESGRAEAEKRIASQTDALYELSPLFLNNLQNVTLQGRTMRMSVGRSLGKNVRSTGAKRITLEITDADGTTRNDRLLLLSEGSDSKWKLALPADSEFKIKRPIADQFSLRSGGGYAFLPLPSLNWPWRIHLHLDCPTNLARSDWNPAEQTKTEAHLQHAASELARWLTQNSELWHPSWQPADILTEAPFDLQTESSARVFAEAYREALNGEPSLRTLWGTLTVPERASGLMLEPGQAVIDAWSKMSEFVPTSVQDQFPLVLLGNGVVHLDLPRLKTEKASEVFDLLRAGIHDAVFWQAYVLAVLGTVAESSGGYSRSELIGDLLGLVPLNRPVGGAITIEQASQSRFAVRLTTEWHEFFRHLSANWLSPNWPLADLSVFGMHISEILRALSSPSEAPTGWDEVMRMTKEDFREHGRGFWTMPRAPCPPSMADNVIRALWVESGQNWLPLAETWVGSESIAMLKGIVHRFDRQQGELNDNRRNEVRAALDRWAVDDEYNQIILQRLEEQAFPEFKRRLNDENPNNPARLRMLILAVNWNPANLPSAWREPVIEAAKTAIIDLFENAGFGDQRGKTILVGGGGLAKVLAWLPAYLEAPAWLEPDAVQMIENQGILRDLRLSCMELNRVNQEQKAKLGRELLEGFRHWPQPPYEQGLVATMSELFHDATNTWTVGYAGGADKRLNEHCCWIQPRIPGDARTPQECVIAGAEQRELSGGAFLPEPLAAVPELREKCFQVHQLMQDELCPDEDDVTILVEAEIPEALTQNPWFQRLRQLLPNASIVSLAGRQKLRWKRGEMELVISKASFGICKVDGQEVIFVADSTRQIVPADNTLYLPVLVAYTQVAPDDKVIAKAVRSNRGLRKIYIEHRAKIKARLVQAHASDMGYEAEHVMRELLQNAESAYASRRPELLPERATFEVSAKSEDHGAAWRIEVGHYGRAFNETDKTGNERSDDIERLCALAGSQNRTPEEVGRFNRGFKSVFQVTDEVQVASGGYTFKIKDLLLLDPAEPTRSPENNDLATRFTFEVNADKKLELFRENGGRERAFEAIELVFLRYVSLIVIKIIDNSERSFEIERGQTTNGWQPVRINERDGEQTTSTSYLVCQNRDDQDQRIAVAVALDEANRPESISEDNRYLYRTFPLKQKSGWFPFLLNADFLTDHGRAGLSPKPENEIFLVSGLQMSLSLVRKRIENCSGDFEVWCAWVNALERRKLSEGSTAVPIQRNAFESEIRQFDTWLWQHLPDGEALRPAADFVFPSRLIRRLNEMPEWSAAFNFEAGSWVAHEVSEALVAFGSPFQPPQSLQSHVAQMVARGADKEELRRCLEDIQGLEFAQDIVSRMEVEAALGLVARYQVVQFRELLELLPTDFLSADKSEEVETGIEAAALVLNWNETEALNEFTLAGWMGKLVFEGLESESPTGQRSILESRDSQKGKECWYRLFCLGSLLGARALPHTVRRFWEGQLAPRRIFDAATGGGELAKILDEISHRAFADLDATGENAEMWRCVFYDFQKLRLFVFEDDLPGAFLEHIQESQEWDSPIKFLKSGSRESGERWAGVLGQSMTAPLFWIMRELRRIELISSSAFDSSCFYMNGPARRIAVRLRWLDEEDRRAYRFEQLLTLSETCHSEMRDKLSGSASFFDLPLQWYAHKNPR